MGPRHGALLGMASALNAAPPVQRLAALAPGAARSGVPGPVVQGVFLADGLDVSAKAAAAFKIFAASIPDGSASKFVQISPDVQISFEVSRYLAEARGDTSKQVELFDDFVGFFDSGTVGKLGGAHNIRNKKTIITIRLNPNFVAQNSPAVIAKTLAHELGAHVAPYADIFRRAAGDEGLTDEDIAHMEDRGQHKGAGDHAAIRERNETEYENIVRTMVDRLGGPDNRDAQDVVYHYVIDISRYDARGIAIEDAGLIQARAKQVLAQGDMAWALPYIHNHSSRPKGISALQVGLIGVTVLVGLLSTWLGYHRYFAEGGA